MDQQEIQRIPDTVVLAKAIWETLSTTQQKMVLQTLVRICCQIAEQQMPEVGHEPITK